MHYSTKLFEIDDGILTLALNRPDELLAKAYAIAGRIRDHSPVAIALTIQMMCRNASRPHPLEAHQVDSLAIFYSSQVSGKEGIQAFLEKRKPVYPDKVSQDMPAFYPWWD